MVVKKSKARILAGIAAAGLVVVLLIANGIIVFDHSGVRRGEGVYWNNTLYVLCSGEYTEGKTIAKTNDGQYYDVRLTVLHYVDGDARARSEYHTIGVSHHKLEVPFEDVKRYPMYHILYRELKKLREYEGATDC